MYRYNLYFLLFLLIQPNAVLGAVDQPPTQEDTGTICCSSDPPAQFKSVRLGFSARDNCVPLSIVDRATYRAADYEICKSAAKAEPYIKGSFDPNEDCSDALFKSMCERRNQRRQQAVDVVCCQTSYMGRSWFYFANAWTCVEMDGGVTRPEAQCTDDENPDNSRLDATIGR